MASIAIVLINYNTTRLTKKCVRSLLAHKAKTDTYTIAILDNASRQPPTEADFPNCRLLLSPKNLGFAEGNNVVVKEILRTQMPDFLLLLNNDTRVTRGMVTRLVEGFESDPDIGIAVPKIYFEHGFEYYAQDYTRQQRGRVIWYAGGGIDWDNLILTHRGIDEVDRGQFGAPAYQDFATGCCMLTTPAIWKKLRGFDTRYFLYYEDADLSERLVRKLHRKIALIPEAILYHQNAGSSHGSGSTIHHYYQTRNRLRFGLEYASVRTKLALLMEARRQFLSGNQAVKLAILHAIGGIWGNQSAKISAKKPYL